MSVMRFFREGRWAAQTRVCVNSERIGYQLDDDNVEASEGAPYFIGAPGASGGNAAIVLAIPFVDSDGKTKFKAVRWSVKELIRTAHTFADEYGVDISDSPAAAHVNLKAV